MALPFELEKRSFFQMLPWRWMYVHLCRASSPFSSITHDQVGVLASVSSKKFGRKDQIVSSSLPKESIDDATPIEFSVLCSNTPEITLMHHNPNNASC
jgi:hypothetical protein